MVLLLGDKESICRESETAAGIGGPMRLTINTTAGSVMYYCFLRARFRNMNTWSPSFHVIQTQKRGIFATI